MSDYGNDIFTLSDDEGNEYEFEVLDMAEIEGQLYAALSPVYEDPSDILDEEDGQLVLLKVVEDENGDELFEDIADDGELEKVYSVFEQRFADSEEFELQQ